MFSALKKEQAPGVSESGLLARIEAERKLARSQWRGWQPHFEESRKVVESFLEIAEPGLPIQILTHGAGLRDLPLAALQGHLSGADIVSPAWWPADRRALKGLKGLTPKTKDISSHLEAYAADPTAPVSKPDMPWTEALVISHNYLSHLLGALAPLRHMSDDDIDRVQGLTEAHLNALKDRPGPAVLMTPYARYETRKGKSERIPLIPTTVLKSDPERFWNWHLAPRGALESGLDVHVAVGVWTFNMPTGQ